MVCGISHDEFWTLTPHELNLAYRAMGDRTKVGYQIAAWHVSYVINMFRGSGSSAVSPADLLDSPTKIEGKEGVQRLAKDATMRWLGIDEEGED